MKADERVLQLIKDAFLQKGYTQQLLARDAGLSIGAVNKILTGKTRLVTDSVCKVLSAMGYELDIQLVRTTQSAKHTLRQSQQMKVRSAKRLLRNEMEKLKDLQEN